MDYKEKLKHYADCDEIKDDDLLDEAITTLEGYFDNMDEDELMHHSRVNAISYLALKHIKDTTNQ